jgi:glutamyl-tRNA reductase
VADDVLRDMGPLAAEHAVTRFEEDALLHLFRVTASLDSMVVGEAQIQGQVKEAYSRAQEAGACGAALARALSAALSAAKRVRTETSIARGAISLSSVAVQMAQKVLGDLSGRAVLLVGAGETAQLAARELHAYGASQLLVANRTSAAAEALAKDVSGIAVSLLELPALLERADVVLCSTASRQPLVTRDLVSRVIKARRYRPLFLIDLALPRNIEPAVNQLENAYVYDLDDLERIAAQNRGLREQEVQLAEAIVREEITAYARAKQERAAMPVLARLRAHAQALADAEAERTLSLMAPLSERQQKSVRAMAAAIVNKLLHTPTARLRGEQGGPLADAVAELFGIPREAESEPPAERSEPSSDSGSERPAERVAAPADVLPLTRRQ